MRTPEVKDALEAAAEVLRRDGWAPGPWRHSPDGRHSLSGALCVATGVDALVPANEHAPARWLEVFMPPGADTCAAARRSSEYRPVGGDLWPNQ